jgi:hypothetical protein
MSEVTNDEPSGGEPKDEEPKDHERAARRRALFAALVVMGSITGYLAVRRLAHFVAARPTEEQCAALLDRYLEQASRQREPLATDEDIARAKEHAPEAPTYVADLDSCRRRLTAAQVQCGLEAPNVDDLERCLQ